MDWSENIKTKKTSIEAFNYEAKSDSSNIFYNTVGKKLTNEGGFLDFISIGIEKIQNFSNLDGAKHSYPKMPRTLELIEEVKKAVEEGRKVGKDFYKESVEECRFMLTYLGQRALLTDNEVYKETHKESMRSVGDLINRVQDLELMGIVSERAKNREEKIKLQPLISH